jgi:hypothetical protein
MSFCHRFTLIEYDFRLFFLTLRAVADCVKAFATDLH